MSFQEVDLGIPSFQSVSFSVPLDREKFYIHVDYNYIKITTECCGLNKETIDKTFYLAFSKRIQRVGDIRKKLCEQLANEASNGKLRMYFSHQNTLGRTFIFDEDDKIDVSLYNILIVDHED